MSDRRNLADPRIHRSRGCFFFCGTPSQPHHRRVHFVGWAEGDKLQRYLEGMNLLFNPSLAPETFCVSNIEAMAAGTPVAAFGIGGMLEYLSPGDNSFVLDDADPRAAAVAIASVLRDRPRLERLAAAGKRDVLTSFRADTALERWAELYEALGRGAQGSAAARVTKTKIDLVTRNGW